MRDQHYFHQERDPFMHWGGDWGKDWARNWGMWGKAFGAQQARRGDMRPIVLHMLAEKPMHGYEIIRTLEEKSHGFWRPSPGSIYPTLQLLEEEELVNSSDENGKKVYTLTDKGRAEAEHEEARGPWHDPKMKEHLKSRHNFMELIGLLKAIAATGTDEQRTKAREVLEETKTKLHDILEQESK